MDGITTYAFTTAAWLALQATPLILTPKIIVAMLSPEIRDASSIEVYLARTSGLTLLFFALLTLLLTGSLPFTTSPSLSDASDSSPSSAGSPYTTPTLTITGTYHALTGFYCYTVYVGAGLSGFLLGAVASGVLAAMGLWCAMFAGGSHISKRTGKDKRVSGFPFGNAEAEKAKGRKRL